MSNAERNSRRTLITGLVAGASAIWAARSTAVAQSAPPVGAGAAMKPAPAHNHAHGPVPAGQAPTGASALGVPPAYKALLQSTEACARAGRICLARSTDHLAAGMVAMAPCQRAVLNMLAVVEAMTSVVSYASADGKLTKQLGQTCAAFCRACAAACQPHAAMHDECKACEEACLACAKACEALAA